VVDCTGLENRQRATVREFESHRLRQKPNLAGLRTLALPGAPVLVDGRILRRIVANNGEGIAPET
jgi:hypothetical protein